MAMVIQFHLFVCSSPFSSNVLNIGKRSSCYGDLSSHNNSDAPCKLKQKLVFYGNITLLLSETVL